MLRPHLVGGTNWWNNKQKMEFLPFYDETHTNCILSEIKWMPVIRFTVLGFLQKVVEGIFQLFWRVFLFVLFSSSKQVAQLVVLHCVSASHHPFISTCYNIGYRFFSEKSIRWLRCSALWKRQNYDFWIYVLSDVEKVSDFT